MPMMASPQLYDTVIVANGRAWAQPPRARSGAPRTNRCGLCRRGDGLLRVDQHAPAVGAPVGGVPHERDHLDRRQLRIHREHLRREVRDVRRRHRRPGLGELLAAGDHAFDLVAVGVRDDRRAVARERSLVAGAIDRADRHQVRQHDAGGDVLDERRVLVAVAGRGDEQDVRRARESLRQRVLRDVEVLARQRLALLGRLADAADLEIAPRCP